MYFLSTKLVLVSNFVLSLKQKVMILDTYEMYCLCQTHEAYEKPTDINSQICTLWNYKKGTQLKQTFPQKWDRRVPCSKSQVAGLTKNRIRTVSFLVTRLDSLIIPLCGMHQEPITGLLLGYCILLLQFSCFGDTTSCDFLENWIKFMKIC